MLIFFRVWLESLRNQTCTYFVWRYLKQWFWTELSWVTFLLLSIYPPLYMYHRCKKKVWHGSLALIDFGCRTLRWFLNSQLHVFFGKTLKRRSVLSRSNWVLIWKSLGYSPTLTMLFQILQRWHCHYLLIMIQLLINMCHSVTIPSKGTFSIAGNCYNVDDFWSE